MRIIVSGGGTGGHIYPAITIIRALKARVPEAEFLYVGTRRGLEADIVPKEGLPFATIDLQGFERHITLDRTMWGSDQASSLEPTGLTHLVRDIRIVEQAMGDGVKRIFPGELAPLSRLRRVDA